jgi:hypothetical protein
MFCVTRLSTRITRASQTSQEWLRLPKTFRLTGDCCQQDLLEVFDDYCGSFMLEPSLRKAAMGYAETILLRLYISFLLCVYALCKQIEMRSFTSL